MSNDDCLACHNDSSLTKDENGKQVSLHVDDAKFKASVHSSFGCTDCHTDIKGVPHEGNASEAGLRHVPRRPANGLRSRRPRQGRRGGQWQRRQVPGLPRQRSRDTSFSDPKSKVARTNIPQTCGACHGKKFVMASSGVSSAPFTSYQQSVHGKAVAGRFRHAAVCTDCHGEHDILGAGDPKSPIAKLNVPMTCAKCHDSVEKEFAQSTHGQAIARGNWAAPVCTDCHGIHSIKAPSDPKSAVASGNVGNTCAACHASVKLSAEFGVPGARVSPTCPAITGWHRE